MFVANSLLGSFLKKSLLNFSSSLGLYESLLSQNNQMMADPNDAVVIYNGKAYIWDVDLTVLFEGSAGQYFFVFFLGNHKSITIVLTEPFSENDGFHWRTVDTVGDIPMRKGVAFKWVDNYGNL